MTFSKRLLALTFAVVSGACAADSAPLLEVGSRSEPVTKNALRPRQAKTVLRLIDNICGDTWCEGDFNFAFRRIDCDARAQTCTLSLELISRDEGAEVVYPRTCTTGGFTGFASLVETSSSGYQSLNWDYYTSLTECISRTEDELAQAAR
jgi:hypothetical protein